MKISGWHIVYGSIAVLACAATGGMTTVLSGVGMCTAGVAVYVATDDAVRSMCKTRVLAKVARFALQQLSSTVRQSVINAFVAASTKLPDGDLIVHYTYEDTAYCTTIKHQLPAFRRIIDAVDEDGNDVTDLCTMRSGPFHSLDWDPKDIGATSIEVTVFSNDRQIKDVTLQAMPHFI